jgi:hypothetical protein
MYNYLKCKYDIKLSATDTEKLDRDVESITFLTKPINGKVGEFLIRSNGELCHNVTEYEPVSSEEIGTPGVIWNGVEYARVKNTDWLRVDYSDDLEIESQIISKKIDASIKVNFKFERGYVVSCEYTILFIDNTERLAHDDKIKKLAIKRAIKYNSFLYKFYCFLIRNPLIYIFRTFGYIGIYIQDVASKLEKLIKQKL